MNESILESIKKLLGISVDYTHFNSDLITHINSVLMILTQVGVGPESGYSITGSTETWQDFLGTYGASRLMAVRTYIYLKVKIVFDPPQSSAALESLNHLISEFEWRLNVAGDNDHA